MSSGPPARPMGIAGNGGAASAPAGRMSRMLAGPAGPKTSWRT
jgi:hypothetical protein